MANTEYTAQFSFISIHPDAQQPGLAISVSPDNGEGGRMSYVGLTDTPGGIKVTFYDTPMPNGDFVAYDLGTLPRDVPHTIKFWIKFNPSPTNDLVRIYIDGKDAGQCFTTWENFYRATSQQVPISDRLLFLSGGRTGDVPSLVGGGYLFDNVSTTTSDGPGPPGCGLPIEKQADLQLTKTPSTTAPAAGDAVSFALTVLNHGPSVAAGTRVTDTLPAALTLVSAPGCTAAGATLTCQVGTLAAGDSRTFTVTAKVAVSAAGHDVVNVASATSDIPDPVSANNSDQATLSVTPPPTGATPPPADLALTKHGPRRMIVGHRARYVLTVTNRGPDTATRIVATDRLPSGLRFVAASTHPGRCSGGRTVRCTLASLAAHGQMRITVTVVPRAGGAVVNLAQVEAATADPDLSNNTARAGGSILGRTRLAVTKTADRAAVASGGLVRYRITVRNAGRAAAVGVTVCDRPSRGLALVRFHGARLRDGAACWSIQRLAVGRHRSLAVLARATSTGSGGRVTNAIIARGANLPPARATATVHVLPAPGRPVFTG